MTCLREDVGTQSRLGADVPTCDDSGMPDADLRDCSSGRTVARLLRVLEIPLLVAVPAALAAAALFQFDQSALFTFAVALVAVGMLFAGFEAGRPALRQIMPAAVLGALAAAGRILFAPVPDFKPVSAICILAGVVFGRRSGFIVGALAALVSNFFFGQGPWTPWQMYAWGLIGYLAGILADAGAFGKAEESPAPRSRAGRARRAFLYVYGLLSALLYGLLLNGWTLVGFVHPITWQSALAIYGAGLPFDLLHGAATVVFLAALYEPWSRKLNRIKRKYALADSGAPEVRAPQSVIGDEGSGRAEVSPDARPYQQVSPWT